MSVTKFALFGLILLSLDLCSCKYAGDRYRSVLIYDTSSTKHIRLKGAEINGRKEGLWLTYDDSGLLRRATVYVHGNATGECFYFHDDGKTLLSHGFLTKDTMECAWTFYWDEKHISERGQMRKNKRIGIWEFYTFDGRLNRRIDFLPNGAERVLIDNRLPENPY